MEKLINIMLLKEVLVVATLLIIVTLILMGMQSNTNIKEVSN
jgi:hypothetical protein